MFSPLNDPQVEHWFQRLNAPLKRLPADERAEVHQEVRQHLEGLAVANEELGSTPAEALELALQQFGDPGRFGKKMAQEWHRSKTGFRADTASVIFVIGYQTMLGFAFQILTRTLNEHHQLPFTGIASLLGYVLVYGAAAVLYSSLGRKYPNQAMRGAFYGHILFCLGYNMLMIEILTLNHAHVQPLVSTILRHSLVWTPIWTAADVIVAYLASVTKRGWYKPTLDDFKLTLPKRRMAE